MKMRSVFARNLRLLRQRSALSQEKLARLAGLDRNYVGKLEREQNSPTIDTVEVLAVALGVDFQRLIANPPTQVKGEKRAD
ncbi:helix-turn-helix domain-containing protein [Pseudaminobacter sp. NGMCC 1.201702]|uniref:helix-turn-helix domain-containing protein n=1 Tax=Pseudaminobacter sp. NGMCC 1.201702 TaxID=3391825 RepID=UPI0039EDEB19